MIFLLSVSSKAQQFYQDTILLYAHYSDVGVKLKIAPQKALTWLKGAEKGYDIYRKEAGSTEFTKINQSVLKPMTKSEVAGLKQGDSIYELNQKAIFDNLAKTKMEMGVYDRVAFARQLQDEYGLYFLLASRIPELSRASGLEYLDTQAKPNVNYVYQVRIHGDQSNSRMGTQSILTQETEMFIPEISAQSGDMEIILDWEHQRVNNPVLCYYIEKSSDGKNFTTLNQSPFYPSFDDLRKLLPYMSYKDTLEANYVKHFYRLRGIDIWGEEHISPYITQAMGKDLIPVAVPSLQAKVDEERKSITYNWKKPMDGDLKGYYILHSTEAKGRYSYISEELFGAETTSYTLDSVQAGSHHYLRIVTIDTAGNRAMSEGTHAYLNDFEAPGSPKGFSLKADSNGVVYCSWKANPELDIKGYKIFRSRRANGKWIAINSILIRDTTYMDTLINNAINQNRYYCIAAIDHSFNISEYSAAVNIQLPDTIGPAAPKFNPIRIDQQVVTLNWNPSASKDVKAYVMLRRKTSDTLWQELKQMDIQQSKLDDEPGIGSWAYTLVAIDSSGNQGCKSYPVYVEVKKNNILASLEKPEVKKQKNGIRVQWEKSQEVKQYILYRSSGGDNMEKVAVLTTNEYMDKALEKGESYRYVVVAQSHDGQLSESETSKKVNF
jgi:fibronectin type 3 domain-containing protein